MRLNIKYIILHQSWISYVCYRFSISCLACIVVFHLSCCAWANSTVPQGLYINHNLWCIIGLCIADFAFPSVFCHDLCAGSILLCLKFCLFCRPCSSSSRLTSCLSSRAWPCPWPLCRWAWASLLSQPSPPPLASSPSPPCWPPKLSWPRRRKHHVTELTATARKTETSLIRWCSHSALILETWIPKSEPPLAYSLSPGLPLSDLSQHGLQSHHHRSNYRTLTNSHCCKSFGTCPSCQTSHRSLHFCHVWIVSLSSLSVSFFRCCFFSVCDLAFLCLYFYQDPFLFLFLPVSLLLCLTVLIPV